MIIRTNGKFSDSTNKEKLEKIEVVKNEEKIAEKPAIKKEKKKKYIAPVVEETIEVVEENKSEDEDLSQWLKEHDED